MFFNELKSIWRPQPTFVPRVTHDRAMPVPWLAVGFTGGWGWEVGLGGGAGPLWRRLRFNPKSSVGLPIALPQVLTTGGSGRIATSLKTGFPGSGVSSFGERAGVASFGGPSSC